VSEPPRTARSALGAMTDDRLQLATHLMQAFADRTGLDGRGDPRRRYLWTDAFAVRVLLVLHTRTGAREHLDRAFELVDLVHHVLGRHREDDVRRGWISGLPESQGERHPTAGGLRIGKPLPERRLDEPRGHPHDDRLEWDRDGQYFHYLTQWMHALERLAHATAEPRWIREAIELAEAACRGFVRRDPVTGAPRMAWKASIDLSRPIVDSMGHHDPLDGAITLRRLAATAARLEVDSESIEADAATLRSIGDLVPSWATTDPLGIGGLLAAAHELVDLIAAGEVALDSLLPRVLADTQRSLEACSIERELASPHDRRLAFREMGLAIGLRGVTSMRERLERAPAMFGGEGDLGWFRSHCVAIERFEGLADRIEASWASPAGQASRSWNDHLDIDAVMLAASLVA
jgi:hypothetical protein